MRNMETQSGSLVFLLLTVTLSNTCSSVITEVRPAT